MSIFKDTTILGLGMTGSWGRELTRQLLELNPRKVIIFSRGEINHVDMQRKFTDPRLEFVIGDVRDNKAVDNAMKGVDYVFFLAALKHVPICESQPWEAIETNVIGIKNAIDCAVKHKVKKMVLVSTDKACDPYTTYGLTKAMAERLMIQANCLTPHTEFLCIRSGNVLGTNGSVIPYILNQIKTTNTARITDPAMTRFFTVFTDAARFLLFATEQGKGGEIYVTNMPSFYIKDLVELLVSFYGNANTKIEIIGNRGSEKIHEVLVSEYEIGKTYYVNRDCYCIIPQLKTGRDYPFLGDEIILKKPLTSADNLKDKAFLIELLKQGGWLQ